MSWAERWRELAADGAGSRGAQRLEQGRYLSRRGGVDSLEVRPGRLTAAVREGRLRPLRAAIDVPVIDDAGWERLTAALASSLRFRAALLEGRLPQRITGVFDDAGAPLLPDATALRGSCTCGEALPCKHVGALHEAFARRLADDPFLLFDLRGRDRGTTLANLRRRAGVGAVPAGAVPLDDLPVATWDVAGPALDELTLHPQQIEDPAWLFHHLGEPPAVEDTAALEQLLGRAAAFAWRLAAGEGTSAADEELLLAELRAQRTATATAIGGALGWSDDRVREQLDRLFTEGRVMRTGSGERTRYRAAPGG